MMKFRMLEKLVLYGTYFDKSCCVTSLAYHYVLELSMYQFKCKPNDFSIIMMRSLVLEIDSFNGYDKKSYLVDRDFLLFHSVNGNMLILQMCYAGKI